MSNPHAEILRTLRGNRNEMLAWDGYSEEDTKRLLISPLLSHLGYPDTYRRSELEDNNNKPDEVIWDTHVSLSGGRPARIILEAKPLGTDFDRGPSRSETPARQLRRYLQGHSASGGDTYGVLTDGNRYRITQRTGHLADIRHVGEWNILDEQTSFTETDQLRKLFDTISLDVLVNTARPVERIPDKAQRQAEAARRLTNSVADGDNPLQILNLLTPQRERNPEITSELQLTGRPLDAARNDWKGHEWRRGVEVNVAQPSLEPERIIAAIVEYTPSEHGLSRGDVALAARTFARLNKSGTAVVFAFQTDSDGVSTARLAVHHQGHTGMTQEFDSQNPPPSILRSVGLILDVLHSARPIRVERLTDAVTAKEIRREFYQQIAQWTRAKQSRRSPVYRQTVLRHLIRTVFAWILKEDGVVPLEPFEEWFAVQYGNNNYHSNILTFLFHHRLNVPGVERVAHPSSDEVDDWLSGTPFLNGSLFAEHPGDQDLVLSNDDYFGANPNRPGLFTIMSRYDWTTAEHTPNESEQTIDPEMLSNLFENLVAATEFWVENPDRMPKGTYYTPADVATEMVMDALSAAIRKDVPVRMSDDSLRELFGNPDADFSRLTANQNWRLCRAISSLSIFDPSVGSGEFPLIVVTALRTALNTLGDDSDDLTRRIVTSQIHAQDINQMAAQITRLRLFIAIVAAERRFDAIEALPNLEARIVCADTLETVARPEWRPEAPGQLVDSETRDALTDLARVRREWLGAHKETQKVDVRRKDADARRHLLAIQERRATSTLEMDGFARHELLGPDSAPASTDARLLFYDPDWSGFDIVIGNPPYEAIAKGQKAEYRRSIKERLTRLKEYRTVGGGDLYNLFCEVALTLVKQEDGVVTLVVPLSLAFGQNKAETRRLFEHRSKSIRLRHQDNRPDKTFHESPVANPENRQRTTVITAVTGDTKVIIETTGTGKWGKSERELYLLSRRYAALPPVARRPHAKLVHQWPRVPSEAVSRLVSEVQAQRQTIASLAVTGVNKRSIAFPQSAYEFITSAPAGKLKRREIVQPIKSTPSLELAMAVLNGHVAYTWWRVWGDAFDINDYELSSFAIPDEWLDDSETNAYARSLGRKLIRAITPANIELNKSGIHGNSFENVNFYKVRPDIIREIDELYLRSLGLPLNPLLDQLYRIRSNSNWRL